jgi:DNA-binding transcriptional MerR regulator
VSTSEPDTAVELSIGEVLELIQQDFPDVTISKIRFLESQGLIQPGRTASGYRRFNSGDIERLRWILRQQRDHFLPLKVIRHMLDEGIDRLDDGDGTQPTLWSRFDESGGRDGSDDDGDPDDDLDDDLDDDEFDADLDDGHGDEDPAVDASGIGASGQDAAEVDPPGSPADRSRTAGGRSAHASGRGSARPVGTDPAPRRVLETPADVVAALQEDPRPARPRPPEPRQQRDPLWAGRPDVDQPTHTADEICAVSGIDADQLDELERFGLVRAEQRAGEAFYGDAALEVATLAARAAGHGISARHLRMYLVSAEREAGFIEQLAMPLLKQRNPAGRDAAIELSAELADLGADLHAALLRRELGPVLGERA